MTAAQQDQAPMATPGCREGETYDVVVLGAGPVGQNVADRARAGGLRVAVVVNRPGMSGDSSSWKGWGHVRWFIEEVPAGAA